MYASLCCLPKAERLTSAGPVFYLDPNVDKETKGTETCKYGRQLFGSDGESRKIYIK